MVLKGVQMCLFGNNFRTTGVRELKFCRMVRAYCEQLLANFQVAATNSLEVMAVLVFWKFCFCFVHARYQWSLGVPWVDFGTKVWILMVDANFGGKQANGIQNLEFVPKSTVVLKWICFEWLGQTVLDFDRFDCKILGCEAMDMNEFNLFNNLTAYDFCVQNVGFYL